MPLELKRIQALCFDVDGTLSDTDDLWVTRLEKLLKPLQFAFPHHEVRPFARWSVMSMETPGNLMYHWMDHLGWDDELGNAFNFLARHSRQKKASNYWIIPRVHEALTAFQNRYPMSIVSARDQDTTLAFLDFFGLRSLFKVIVTAQTCEHTKPFPEPVLWAAKQMGVPAANCLMIGDTVVDIRAGKDAGAQTVGVLCGFGRENELRKAGADLVLPHTAHLMDHLLM